MTGGVYTTNLDSGLKEAWAACIEDKATKIVFRPELYSRGRTKFHAG